MFLFAVIILPRQLHCKKIEFQIHHRIWNLTIHMFLYVFTINRELLCGDWNKTTSAFKNISTFRDIFGLNNPPLAIFNWPALE
ncbi:hypothetical protein CW304_21360 [Bacillus sp. UFRGS-B20]|nr:hypothetical protein CW304_21360 [Bacillus sp. UFRGS-B20]